MRSPTAPHDADRAAVYAALNVSRLRSTVTDNSAVQSAFRMLRWIHHRWLAFCFARRFYDQASHADPIPAEASAAPAVDLTESLFRQSLPAKIHALVQLRVCSQIASIRETSLRAQMCREAGWSSEQTGAALLGTVHGFPERETLMLRYAEDMTRTPIDIDPQIVRQLRAFLSEAEMIELTAAIAHENFRVRFSEAKAKSILK